MISNTAITTVIRGVLGTNAVAHEKEVSVRKIKPIPTENRRYSILRASGHTFEYVGFGPGNYSTAMPQVQDRVRSEDEELIAQSLQTRGGFVVYSGMNDAGDFYIGGIKIEAGSNSLKFLNSSRVDNDEVGLPADATFDNLVVDVSLQSNGDTEIIDLLLKGNRSGDIGQSVYVGIQGGNTTPTSNVDNILFRTSHDAGGYIGWVKTGSSWKRFGPVSKSGEVQAYQFDTLEVTGVSTFSGRVDINDDLEVRHINATGIATASSFVGNGTIPIGGIIMWSGADNAVPSNYALCDGNNGTPNLVDRFIVGRGSAYAQGATGGSADATLVSHSHTINDHTHGFSGTGSQVHSHTQSGGGTSDDGGPNVPGSNSGGNQNNISNATVTITISGNTGNPIDKGTDTQGSSGTNKNLPPYYAIAYIMRIS